MLVVGGKADHSAGFLFGLLPSTVVKHNRVDPRVSCRAFTVKTSTPAFSSRPDAGQADPGRGCQAKLLSPSWRRRCVTQGAQRLKVSQRRACRVIGQARSTQRHPAKVADDEEALRKVIVGLAERFGRYGYRRITALLRNQGWRVNHKRVERIWRQEGLKVPQRQPKRRRLWLNDGSCIRLRPKRPNHVWSYGFVADRTREGRAYRMLTVIDEYTRRCLAITVPRRLRSDDVLHTLTELFVQYGPPEHMRSDNGPEFTARGVRKWLEHLGVRTLFIEPGSPWENEYN